MQFYIFLCTLNTVYTNSKLFLKQNKSDINKLGLLWRSKEKLYLQKRIVTENSISYANKMLHFKSHIIFPFKNQFVYYWKLPNLKTKVDMVWINQNIFQGGEQENQTMYNHNNSANSNYGNYYQGQSYGNGHSPQGFVPNSVPQGYSPQNYPGGQPQAAYPGQTPQGYPANPQQSPQNYQGNMAHAPQNYQVYLLSLSSFNSDHWLFY